MLRVHESKFGNVAVLCLEGRIVRGEIEPLRRAVLAQLESEVVVLDLVCVNTIDAGGLGALLELRELTESSGIEFRLMNVTRLVGQVLEITRLNSVFDIATEREILSRMRPAGLAALQRLPACGDFRYLT